MNRLKAIESRGELLFCMKEIVSMRADLDLGGLRGQNLG